MYTKLKMFLYRPEVFTENVRMHLMDELYKVELKDEKNYIAQGRLRSYIHSGMKTHRAFTSPKLAEYLSNLLGKPVEPAANVIPIEYRKYPTGCNGMLWHRDTIIIRSQYECVYTLTNTSDSLTKYRSPSGTEYSVYPESNSIIIVQAGGVEHSVTPITLGERTIVKFVFTETC